MSQPSTSPSRFIGLDVHEHYLVAIGVDKGHNQVLGPNRVRWASFENWMQRHLTQEDAVILEMTTNTWEVHDLLD